MRTTPVRFQFKQVCEVTNQDLENTDKGTKELIKLTLLKI